MAALKQNYKLKKKIMIIYWIYFIWLNNLQFVDCRKFIF